MAEATSSQHLLVPTLPWLPCLVITCGVTIIAATKFLVSRFRHDPGRITNYFLNRSSYIRSIPRLPKEALILLIPSLFNLARALEIFIRMFAVSAHGVEVTLTPELRASAEAAAAGENMHHGDNTICPQMMVNRMMAAGLNTWGKALQSGWDTTQFIVMAELILCEIFDFYIFKKEKARYELEKMMDVPDTPTLEAVEVTTVTVTEEEKKVNQETSELGDDEAEKITLLSEEQQQAEPVAATWLARLRARLNYVKPPPMTFELLANQFHWYTVMKCSILLWLTSTLMHESIKVLDQVVSFGDEQETDWTWVGGMSEGPAVGPSLFLVVLYCVGAARAMIRSYRFVAREQRSAVGSW